MTSLFFLVAADDLALEVVALNPSYQAQGSNNTLVFTTNDVSKTPGRLASFGRNLSNDIYLPTGSGLQQQAGPGSQQRTRGRSYQNYRGNHFYFFLAPSGELIVRDLTPRLTNLEIENASQNEANLFSLHGTNPRQRVVPRTNRRLSLIFGTETVFRLYWNPSLLEAAPHAQQPLVNHALILSPPGNSHTLPSEARPSLERPYQGNLAPHARDFGLRSSYQPSVASQTGPRKACHKYTKLGEGAFGTVWKVVDLSSGELWALKEIKAGAADDRFKRSFKDEVEMLAPLRHDNIVHFECFQDFNIGGNFQLYYRLYNGSISQLLPRHDCSGQHFPERPGWLPLFVDQILSALQYLHDHGVVHRDIKPDNILYDTDASGKPSFYVADFGLSIAGSATAIAHPAAGTPAFMPPEILLQNNGEPGPGSDVWSFAITLGTILGFWCHRELDPKDPAKMDAAWNAKIQALGGNPRPGAVSPAYTGRLTDGVKHIWFRRLYDLVYEDGVLPPMFKRMVAPVAHRASIKECQRASFDSLTLRPPRRTQTRQNALMPGQNTLRPGQNAFPLGQNAYTPGQLHIPALSPNGMSFDVHRGFHS